MKREELASRVLQIVKLKQPIRAVEIAKIVSKEFGSEIKKKNINSVLYSELRKVVIQDEKYCWSIEEQEDHFETLKPQETQKVDFKISNNDISSTKETLNPSNLNKKNTKTKAKPLEPPNTLLGRLASYYLECLSFERDTEVSVYSTSKYDTPEYVQLEALPGVSESFHECWDQESVRTLITKVKRGGANKKLYLGYPVFARPTPKGRYIKLEPLFLFAFNLSNNSEDGDHPTLTDEAPRVNLAGFKGYAEESGNLFDEIIQLQHELGLDQAIEDLPEIDELILRLKNLRPLWPWAGEFNPLSLSDVHLSEVDSAGIYNAAMLVRGEGSKFTRGLENELDHLKSISSDSEYRSSVLAEMLGLQTADKKQHEIDIVEAVQLNYEQKGAVQSVFKNPLTVITGPPGTGKSQVVTAILINAAREGWKVLFTSKNNKAVDVVEHRVNGLCDKPLVLRLGAKEQQKSLAEKLSHMLSTQPSSDSVSNYERLDEKHTYLSKELKEIFDLMKSVITIRNKIDKVDQRLQRAKRKYSPVLFDDSNFPLRSRVVKFEKSLSYLNEKVKRANTSILERLKWKFYLKVAGSSINKKITEVKSIVNEVGLQPDWSLEESSTEVEIEKLAINIGNIKQLVDDINEFNKLTQQIRGLESFEDLCSTYYDVHSELVEVDYELWRSWLDLSAHRMTDSQRQTLGKYVSVLKYIVEANVAGEKINKGTWSDYYKLTQEVSYLLPVWAITSLSANGRLPLSPGEFDLVIIDEASQCDIASVIPLLYRAKRVVILGDPNQLRHITTLSGKQDLQLIEKHGLNEYRNWGYAKNSCFDLATTTSKNIITLREHHRSHQDIIQFSNKNFYNGVLRVATKSENLKKLKGKNNTNVEWHTVSGKVEKYRGSGAYNKIEAQAVYDYIEDLVKNRAYKGSIGVVTPFRGQARVISELFSKSQEITKYLVDSELLVDTVHKFQGDEKDIIIFSPVVSDGISKSAVQFLKSQGNLFNVAITRARSHLAVIGDQAACKNSGVTYLANFVDYVESLKVSSEVKNLSEDELRGEYPKVVFDPNTVSDWEVGFYKAMYKAGLRPIPQYREDKYRLDFAIFDGNRKLNIEVDGEKYHRDWDGTLILEDQVRNDRLKELGWAVKRFWVFQIRDEEDQCIQEVKDWLQEADKSST